MKTLYINRHAKSSWNEDGISDFDRPLNKRGMRDAPFMAKVFAEKSNGVDLILSSPANRAITTANFFSEALGFAPSEVKTDEGIYLASTQDLLRIIAGNGDSIDFLVDQFSHDSGLRFLSRWRPPEHLDI